MNISAETSGMDSFRREISRIQAGEGLGLTAVSGSEISTDKPSFEEWMEAGGMQGALMQEGEGSWASWKCGGGPHSEGQ